MGQNMSWNSKQELAHSVGPRYRVAERSQKTAILNEFVAATGYARKHAIVALGRESLRDPSVHQDKRRRRYNEPVLQVLTELWEASNAICSKRLVPFIPELLRVMERCGHISPDADVRNSLLSVSASTVDRLLAPQRMDAAHGISTTKPGQLLKRQITIRTFADWDDVRPGFFEIDLVAHCGECSGGSFLHTLVLTDVATGWIEFCPLLRRGEVDVTNAIGQSRQRLPMPILGLDTDNGSEFINYEMLRYCERESISFTRARAYKKNDQCHVEEKNGSVVRRLVGYARYEGPEPMQAMSQIYEVLRLYVNFFQPSLKLATKRRDGSHVAKTYEEAKTPYQRLTKAKAISPAAEAQLKAVYEMLDPVDLLTRLAHLQRCLWPMASSESKSMSFTANDILRQSSVPARPKPVLRTARQPETGEVATQNISTSQEPETAAVSLASRCEPVRPKRTYRKRRREPIPHNWRTREDPFAAVYERLRMLLLLAPERTAKDLLNQMSAEVPDTFSTGQLRTLQRRVRQWRRESTALNV
jgi:hypothetical protein